MVTALQILQSRDRRERCFGVRSGKWESMRFNRHWILLGLSAASGTTEVTVHEDKPFPESLSSTSDGSLYIGSLAKSEVLKATKGASTAEV
jgi:hypothetical protein